MINSQVFMMPSKSGLDSWGELGNASWNWDTLEPYFRKFHTLTIPPQADAEHLGLENNYGKIGDTNGPIQASFPNVIKSPLPKAWNETFKTLGFGFKGDLTAGKALGSYSNPATVHPVARERSYSGVAYYQPIMGRPNLQVRTHAHVTKIVFEGDAPPVVATGVEYTHDGQSKIAKSTKEVILAAGALQSPKVLELSGIGAKSVLQSHDIPVVVEIANVGENLQDHLISGISFEVADHVESLDNLGRQQPEALQTAMAEYMTTKSGPFSGAAVFSTAFIPVVDFSESDRGRKDLEDLLSRYPAQPDEPPHYAIIRSILQNPNEGTGMPFMYNAQGNWGGNRPKELVAAVLAENFITISVLLLNPFSVGHVHISSSDPAEPPTIDNQYLSHPLDIEVLARHIFYLNTIVQTEPLVSLLKPDGKRNTLYQPFETLDDVKDYIRKTAMSNWHPCGTCAMLPLEKGGVVDEKLKVYGTKNVRVVDASIMPMIPRANTVTTVYAVAERAADLIQGKTAATNGAH